MGLGHEGGDDPVAGLGHPAEECEDEAGHGLVVLALGQPDVGRALDLVETEGARHVPDALAVPYDAERFRVVLVHQLADELLGQVLQRHHAGQPAVLVDHAGERLTGGGHPPQQLGQRQGRGDEQRRAGDAADEPAGGRAGLQILGQPRHADDVVGVGAQDRIAGVAVRAQGVEELVDRPLGAQRDHARAGDHDVLGGAVAELQRPLQHVGQPGRQFAGRGRLRHDARQLLGGGAVFELLHGLDAEQAHEPGGRGVEQADDRPGDHEIDVRRAGEELRDVLGPRDAEVLGGQLADDHLHDRGDRDAEGHRDAGDGRTGQPGGLERAAQHAGDRGLGDEAHQQGGDGDPELRAGEHERQASGDVEGPVRGAVTGRRLLAEGAAVGGHEGEFLRHEESGGQGEDEDGQEAEGGAHRAPAVRS